MEVLNFFPAFKNWFLPFLKLQKNGIWSKGFFVKLNYLISRVFLAWTFFNFLAHCGKSRYRKWHTGRFLNKIFVCCVKKSACPSIYFESSSYFVYKMMQCATQKIILNTPSKTRYAVMPLSFLYGNWARVKLRCFVFILDC